MPSWNDLITELDGLPDEQKALWIRDKLSEHLTGISRLRDGRNVIFYASAFLQKPAAPAALLQLTREEINGLMSVMYGMDWDDNLCLLLHTPGGVTNAAETFVAYLHSKFDDIEVIIPTYAMSAGTMMSLGADRIVMGRQSQLGPIDPQMQFDDRFVSARAVVEQFETARSEILQDLNQAHLWAPVLQTVGPSLLEEANNALAYGQQMVARWLEDRMFSGREDRKELAEGVAAHFNDATKHKSHGRRIDRDEAREQGLVVEDLEDSQELQEHVLTAYHVVTLLFERSPGAKIITSHAGRTWMKNVNVGAQQQPK